MCITSVVNKKLTRYAVIINFMIHLLIMVLSLTHGNMMIKYTNNA